MNYITYQKALRDIVNHRDLSPFLKVGLAVYKPIGVVKGGKYQNVANATIQNEPKNLGKN